MAGTRRLLAALLVVVAAPLITMGAAGCLPWPCKGDPVARLSDTLAGLTDRADLAANVRAALEYKLQREFMNHPDLEFKLAVSLFSRLDVRDACNIRNFDLMRSLFELASPRSLANIRLTSDGRPLIRLLHNLRLEFKFTCFARLERAWSNRWGRREYFEAKKTPLIHLGPLLERRAERTLLQRDFEMKQLSGALQLQRWRKRARRAADLFAGEELKEALMAIDEQQTGVRALKLDDEESAKKALQEYLLEPCRRLMEERAAIESTLKPILNIAAIILVDDLVRPRGYQAHFRAAGWAGRYAACDLLLEANYEGNQLAAKVAKAR